MIGLKRLALLKHGAPPRNALEAALRAKWGGGGGASYEKTVGPAPIISVADAKAKPAKSLIVGMEPIQDLHGYDSPWPAGGGKQLLNPALFELETSSVDVTAVANDDGTISLSGTATANKYLTVIPYKSLSDYGFIEANVSLTLTGYVNDNVYVIFGIYGSGTDYRATSASGVAMTFTEEQIAANRYRLVIYIANGQNCDGITVKPMICKTASPNPTVFAPYENLCPITGRTCVTAWRTGKNLFNKANTIDFYCDGTWTLRKNSDMTSVYIPLVENTDYIFTQTNIGNFSRYAVCNTIEQDAKIYRPASKTAGFADVTYLPISFNSGGFKYLICSIYRASVDTKTFNEIADSCQLELGSTASDYLAYSGATYPVTWQGEAGTVYGGTVDVVSGLLTVDRASVDLGTLNWLSGWGKWYSSNIIVPVSSFSTAPNILCSAYPAEPFATMPNKSISVIYGGEGYALNGYVIVSDSDYSDANAFKTAMSGVQLCYELATPQTYQLTPTQIQMLKGANVLFSDADDLTLTYIGTEPEES